MSLTIRPELTRLNPLGLTKTDPRHYGTAGVVGFSGGRDYGGSLTDLAPNGKGSEITKLAGQIGASSVLRTGSLGAEGLNRTDRADFANVMLNAIDKVSVLNNRASDLTQQAIVDPDSVDFHDLTIAQAEASMSLNTARTLLSRLTQAWRDLINTR